MVSFVVLCGLCALVCGAAADRNSLVQDFELESEEEDRLQYWASRAQEEKERESQQSVVNHFQGWWNNVRLPTDVKPSAYKVFLDTDLSRLKFKGTVEITLEVSDWTQYIILHHNGLSISSAELKRINSYGGERDEDIAETQYNSQHQQYQIKTQYWLRDGTYSLKLSFSGQLASSSKARGFYYSYYYHPTKGRRYLATTQFQPTDARMAFPCFDEPSFKAKFTISLAHDSDYHALSNMPLDKMTTQSNGRKVSHFKESVKMSTYLVAFVVSDFSYKSAIASNGVEIRTYGPAHKIQDTDFALQVALKVLPYFEKFFSQAYPLPKCDMIGIPHFWAGAMENWGLITYRDSYYYYKSTTSLYYKAAIAKVVVHELAHQWFGNLVTMDWWNDLWLNEGFASFMETVGVDHAIPDWNMDNQFVLNPLQYVMSGKDSRADSHPIIQDVSSPSEIFSLFDSISYKKGASVSRMLRKFMGDSNFFQAFKEYMKKHKYDNTVTDDLWAAMTQASSGSLDVKAIMDTWTKQMGYPIVTLTRSGSIVTAKQEHFLLGGGRPQNSPFGYVWKIPLSYKTQDDPHKSKIAWMSTTTQTLPASSGWIKANLDQMGYYRVNYDDNNWGLIADQLEQDPSAFTAGDRANLLDDAFTLANNGRLNMMIPLDLTRYLFHELDYTPWATALEVLGYAHKMALGTRSYPYFQKYMLKLMEPVMKVIGGDDTGSHVHRTLRRDILGMACLYGSSSATADTKQLFASFMSGSSLPQELALPIIQSGIREGGETEFNFVKNKYRYTGDRDYLYALASTKKTYLLKRLLQWWRDGKVYNGYYAKTVIKYIVANPVGVRVPFEFIRDNWSTLSSKSSGYSLAAYLSEAIKDFSSPQQLSEVRSFINSKSNISENMLYSAISNIERNIAWQNTNGADLYNWLITHHD